MMYVYQVKQAGLFSRSSEITTTFLSIKWYTWSLRVDQMRHLSIRSSDIPGHYRSIKWNTCQFDQVITFKFDQVKLVLYHVFSIFYVQRCSVCLPLTGRYGDFSGDSVWSTVITFYSWYNFFGLDAKKWGLLTSRILYLQVLPLLWKKTYVQWFARLCKMCASEFHRITSTCASLSLPFFCIKCSVAEWWSSSEFLYFGFKVV